MSLLREHNEIVRAQAAMHSGFEVKAQGDGFMLAFASARVAVRCAIGSSWPSPSETRRLTSYG